jgi:hypothetical protein
MQGKGLLLPDGKTELEAEELLLTWVTRHHAGQQQLLIYVIMQGKGLLLPDGKTELEAEELLLTGVTRNHTGQQQLLI